MAYLPKPIDTSGVTLPAELLELVELLARNTHEHWSLRKLAEGWSHGEHRDDSLKTHPCLVPYEDLANSDQEYDRTTATEVLKVLYKHGYRIVKDED